MICTTKVSCQSCSSFSRFTSISLISMHDQVFVCSQLASLRLILGAHDDLQHMFGWPREGGNGAMRPRLCLWSVSRCPLSGAGCSGPPLPSVRPTCAEHAQGILRRHADGGALFATTCRRVCQGGAIRQASAERRRPCPHRREVRGTKQDGGSPNHRGMGGAMARSLTQCGLWNSQLHRKLTSC